MRDWSFRVRAEGVDETRAALRAVAAEAGAVQPPAFDTAPIVEALRQVVEELRGVAGAVDQTAATFNARTAELGGALSQVAAGVSDVGASVAGANERVGQSLTTVAAGVSDVGASVGASLTTAAAGVRDVGQAVGALGRDVADAGRALLDLARHSVVFREMEQDLRGAAGAVQPVAVGVQGLVEHWLILQGLKRAFGVWIPPLALLLGLSEVVGAVGDATDAFGRLGAAQDSAAAALERTGHAAGVTAAEIMAIARAEEDAGRHSQQALAQAITGLTRYEAVSGDVFREASRLIDDVAVRMGTDLPAAAELVGEALTDPARAFDALREAGVRFTVEQRRTVTELRAAGDEAGAQAAMLDLLRGALGGAAAETDEVAAAQHRLDVEWRLLVEAIGARLHIFADLKRALVDLLDVPAAAFLRGVAIAVREIRGLFGDVDDIGREVVRLNKELLDAQERQRKAQEDFDADGRFDQLEHLAQANEQVTSLERRIGELIAKGKAQVAAADKAQVDAANAQLERLAGTIETQLDALPRTVAQRREAINREIDLMVDRLIELRRTPGIDIPAVDREIQKLETLRETRLREIETQETGQTTSRASAAAREDETDALAAFLRDLEGAVALVRLDARERAIQEATVRAQSLALKENNLLTAEQIARIRELVGARYDEEEAERRAADARRTAAQDAQRYAQEVDRTAERIGADISENLWDQITGEADAADALEFFKRWLKRLAVEFLNTRLIMPVTAQVVGSMPSMFGIQAPGGQGGGQAVTVNGQTYVPAGGGSPFGPTTGMGTIDSLASRYAPGMFATPYGSLPPGLQSGIDDVGQLGYTSAHNSSLPFSAGEALTAVGSVVSALSAFQAFSQGRIGSGIGSTVSAGLGIAQLAGVALGPWAPIAMVAAPIIGSLLDGLFGGKPSNKEGGATFDFTTGATVIGGQEGKKFSAENRAAAADANGRIVELGRVLEGYADGGRLRSSVFVGVGGRDPLRAQYTIDGVQTERRFGNDEAGVKEMAGWFVENFARELKDKFPPVVASAIDNIDWSDVEQAFEDLDFAKGFEDTVKALNATLGLEDQARRQAKDSVRQTTEAFKTFFETTERLWPSLTTGGTTRTETVREQTTMSAAEAIAAGLIKRESVYLGDATWETRYTDLEGRIVAVTDDLTEAVTVWKEVTKTVTEGGETIASEQARQAREAARVYVDNLVAGNEPATYAEYEAAVAALNARWAEMGPLLEMVGYTAEEVGTKLKEGLANNLANLREDMDRVLLREQRSLTGLGSLTTVEDMIDGFEVGRRNVVAVGGDVGKVERNFDGALRAYFRGLSTAELDAFVEAVSAAGVQLEGATEAWEAAILGVATAVRDGTDGLTTTAADLGRRYRAVTGDLTDTVQAIRRQGTADAAVNVGQALAVARHSFDALFQGLDLATLVRLRTEFAAWPEALAGVERALQPARDDLTRRWRDGQGLGALNTIADIRAQGGQDSLLDPAKAVAVANDRLGRLFDGMPLEELRALRPHLDGMPVVIRAWEQAILRGTKAAEDDARARAASARAEAQALQARAFDAAGMTYRGAVLRTEAGQQREMRDALLAGTVDIGLLMRTQRVEAAQAEGAALAEWIDRQIAALERNTRAAEQAAEAAEANARAYRDSVDDLLTDGSTTNLDPGEVMEELRRQWRAALEAVEAGEDGADDRLRAIGRRRAQHARQGYASADDSDLTDVLDTFRGLGLSTSDESDDRQTMIDLSRQQLDELRTQRDRLAQAMDGQSRSLAGLGDVVSGAIGRLQTSLVDLDATLSRQVVQPADWQRAVFGGEADAGYAGREAEGQGISLNRWIMIARAAGHEGGVGAGEINARRAADPAFRARMDEMVETFRLARQSGLVGTLGFSTGGRFTVGGAGGADSTLVSFRATPGEIVDVRQPWQQPGDGGMAATLQALLDRITAMGRELAGLLRDRLDQAAAIADDGAARGERLLAATRSIAEQQPAPLY